MWDFRLFLRLWCAFIVFVPVAILSHECSHFIVAKCLGYNNAHLSYSSVSYEKGIQQIPAPKKAIANYITSQVVQNTDTKKFLCILAGPFSSLLIGSVAFIILIIKRHSYFHCQALYYSQWLVIFLSLFWLRPVINMSTELSLLAYGNPYNTSNDEYKIAMFLGIPFLPMILISGISGFLVILTVLFKFVPANSQLAFILAGFAGAYVGHWVWFSWVGPVVLP